MESALVAAVQQLTGNLYAWLPGVLGSDTGSSAVALPARAQALFLRADNGEPARVVNVFDGRGNKVYTIERQSRRAKHWYVYTQPDRHQAAALTVGLVQRRVDRAALGATPLRMSGGVLGKLHRHYYDRRGNMYVWSRRSLLLQRVANPGGGSEERRETVARARLLRPGRFDWELLVDETRVDVLTTLATAFITMRTQWLPSRAYAAGAPGAYASAAASDAASDAAPEYEYAGVAPELLAYRPKAPAPGPLNFFNPPKFLEHKFTRAPARPK